MRYLVLPSGHCIEGESFSRREMFLASFDSPGTTDEARNFGYTSTLAGHGKIPMGQFFAGLCRHPYPKSLWKAYQAGRQQAFKELKDRERAWQRQHLEDLRAGRAVSLSGKDHTEAVA